MEIDRLSVRDTVNLYWGESGPGGVLLGWVAIIDREDLGAMTDAEAVGSITAAIGRHLDRLPRLRQRVQQLPLGVGLPIWRNDDDFSVARHVATAVVATPGGREELHAAVETVFADPLPLDRPLWAITVLTGLAGGRLAIVQRVHHTLADGVAGAAIATALLDADAAAFVGSLVPPAAAGAPRARELVADNLRWRAETVGAAIVALLHPVVAWRRLRKMANEATTLLRRTKQRQATGLNQPLGLRRATAVVEVPLAAVKEVGHTAGATVNDVLLAAVAGGLRTLLTARGERADTATMYASVPVSVRTESAAVLGNRTTGLLVDIRVDEPDAGRRLSAIAAETRWQKEHRAWVSLMGVMDSPWVPAWFHRHAVRLMRNQRMINVMVSNVPGPAEPLHIAGAPIRTVFPILPIAVNVPIGVAAISYAGTLVLGVRSDPDLVPDIGLFVAGMEATLAALGATAGVAA